MYYGVVYTGNKNNGQMCCGCVCVDFWMETVESLHVFAAFLKVDQLPRNVRKESWRKKKEELEVSQRQAVSTADHYVVP